MFIASCAAFFSIWGIGLLFSGASISSMVMALSLELGKLVATSFLYRFWKKTQTLLKTYLCVAVFVLMAITSVGIFGYLSSAYQQSSIKYSLMQEQIATLDTQRKSYVGKMEDVKNRITSLSSLRKSQEDRLSQVNTNTLLARNPIQFRQVQEQTMELIDQTDKNIKSENDKSQSYTTEIENIDKKITDIKLSSSSAKDIQTFKFVADSMGVDLNTVVKWFILILIVVFDPLAVALVLAYNITANKEYSIYTPPESPSPKEPTKIETPVQVPTPQPDSPVVKNDTEILSTPTQPDESSTTDNASKSKQDEFFKLNFAHR